MVPNCSRTGVNKKRINTVSFAAFKCHDNGSFLGLGFMLLYVREGTLPSCMNDEYHRLIEFAAKNIKISKK